MADHIVTLTPDQELAFQAKVQWLLDMSQAVPPFFPPVVPVADVDALIASYMVPIITMEVDWYTNQS